VHIVQGFPKTKRDMLRSTVVRALALATLLLPSSASAQTVLVRVLGADASQPLFGALAYLVDEAGATVRTALTDERGRALFAGIEAATYRVRAEMIGMATAETELFEAAAGATVQRALSLESRAIMLEGIEVAAEGGRCRVRPEGTGLLVSDVWDEARKALSAAAFTDQQGVYRYETRRYVRDLDPDTKAIIREERSRGGGYMRSPFKSLPAEDLVENGFVQQEGDAQLYYAPDASVLLSDAFLDTHCFRIVEGGDDRSGLLGLHFEPTREDRGVVDISGTLWLDRGTAELRWLDYYYQNLDPRIQSRDVGGRVDFQRMPAGTWIVPEWWIRMPTVEIQSGPDLVRRPVVVGFRQVGGSVLEAHEAGGRSLGQRVQTGGIEGIVVDSLGALLQGVRVGVVGSNQEVFTNAEGRFSITALTEGVYQVRFIDSGLESFGYLPPPVTREVVRGEMSYIEFHMPSVGEVLFEACRDEPRSQGTGVLVGVVLDESTDRPLQGATVQVRWSDFRTAGAAVPLGLREEVSTLRTTTDADGSYRLCGVPVDERLTVLSVVNDVESTAVTLRIAMFEVGRIHLIRHPNERR